MTRLLSLKTIQRGILGFEIFIALVLIIYTVFKDWSYLKPISMFTIAVDCTCLIINIIFFFGIIGSREDFNINFATICVADFIALLGENGAWITENDPNTVFWAWVSDTLLFIGALLLSVTFFYLACSMAGQKYGTRNIWRSIVNIAALLGLAFILINLFTGAIFRIEPDGSYVKGELYGFYYIIPYFIWILAACILLFSKIHLKMKLFVLILLLVPVTANVVSILLVNISITYSSALIALCILYISYYMNLEQENKKITKAFGRFLSDDIVNQLAGNKSGGHIESRHFRATVLISDIRDFTRISEGMNPKDLMDMINHYFSIMMEILTECGGITTEFMGDGIKAAFGANVRRTDHAEAALKCAVLMQKAMPEINEWNKEHGYPEIQIGIGVHSGVMSFGSIGDKKRFRYSAIGTEVSVCSFVEEQTSGGQILISEDTLDEITLPIRVKYFDTRVNEEINREIKLFQLYNINGIALIQTSDSLKELEHSIPVDIYVSKNKTYDKVTVGGTITSMSGNEAIIRTEQPISKSISFFFKIGEDNYSAKIKNILEGNNTYLIYFTGKAGKKHG